MSKYSKYIGIPFQEKGRSVQGMDCWGLVLYVLAIEHGITGLPDFSGSYIDTKDKENIPKLVDKESRNTQKVKKPKEGDVVLMRLMGASTHVGIMINGSEFIHVAKGIDCCKESVKSPVWVNRIMGYYRYE